MQEVLKDPLGYTIQDMMEAELDEPLGYEKYETTKEAKSNYRNGHTSKALKSSVGPVEINVPRDRNAEFEPKIVPKYKRDISDIEPRLYEAEQVKDNIPKRPIPAKKHISSNA